MKARRTKQKLDIAKLKRKWTYILLSIITLCSYIFVFQSHHYHKWYVFMSAFIGTLSIAVLQHMWFELLPKSKWNKAANALMLVIITAPLTLLLIFLHKTYYSNQLERYGTIVYGRVTNTYSKNGRNGTHYTAVFKYRLNGKEWLQEVGNDHFLYNEHDSLKILCSSEEPEIFTILNVLPIDSIQNIERKYALLHLRLQDSKDTGIIRYQQKANQSGSYEIENNKVEIRFTSHIASVTIQPTNGVYLETAKDVNFDGKSEVLLYSAWPNGYWNDLYVYSLVDNKWKVLGKTRAFVDSNKDSIQRIEIGKDKRAYLIGDEMNSEGEFVRKHILLKTN